MQNFSYLMFDDVSSNDSALAQFELFEESIDAGIETILENKLKPDLVLENIEDMEDRT